jgi:acyl dehydratase
MTPPAIPTRFVIYAFATAALAYEKVRWIAVVAANTTLQWNLEERCGLE